jgi:formylglycine-generating enzyme required for sulfatase activity
MAGTDIRPIDMVAVPGGAFLRGSDLSPDEQPPARVRMSAFLIDRRPVTNADFAAFVADGYRDASLWTPGGWDYIQANGITQPTYFDDPVWSAPDVPVTGVCWWEALAYARFAGKTLPTEAQWEYAARGTDGRLYPWGDDEPTLGHANFAPGCEPVDRRPTAPDAHPLNVSPFGCLDMAGNFAEWCLDNYTVGYRYEGAERPDPVHLADEYGEHVVRGGCGLHSDDYLRCSSRDTYPPGIRDNLIGFRCVARDEE